MSDREFHTLAEIFPPMSDADVAALAKDIKEHGQIEPIVLYEGMILDGRSRYRACLLAGVSPDFDEYDAWSDIDPLAFVVGKNLHRRHLTSEQKREVLAVLLKADPGKSNRQIAKTAQVDHKTVNAVREKLTATGEIPQLSETTGADGKKRPTKKSVAKSAPASDPIALYEQRQIDGMVCSTNTDPHKRAMALERFGARQIEAVKSAHGNVVADYGRNSAEWLAMYPDHPDREKVLAPLQGLSAQLRALADELDALPAQFAASAVEATRRQAMQ
jgi:hypothetical protein